VSDPSVIPEESISDYSVGQDNIRVLGLDIRNPVFLFPG
jgi:hypothetical protein